MDRFYQIRLTVFALLTFYVLYRFIKCAMFVYHVRRKYDDIPHLPRHPIWGNISNAGTLMDPNLPRLYEYGLEEIWEELGRPAVYLIDLAPLTPSLLIVADPDVAESVASASAEYKYSPPKNQNLKPYAPTLGWQSLVRIEGEHWRSLRRRFNPGFQPHYLYSFAPAIAQQTRIYVDRLSTAAASGETITINEVTKDLITDIILEVTTGRNLHAQITCSGQGEKSYFGFIRVADRLSQLIQPLSQKFNPLLFLNLVRSTKERFYERVLYGKIRKWVLDDFKAMQTIGGDATPDRKSLSGHSNRSITQLAMSGLPLSEELVNSTVDQVKTFFYAGRDTTVMLVDWMTFYLSKASKSAHYAQIVQRLRAEHDAVFGGDSAWSGLTTLAASNGSVESILNSKLPYTTAFIKETLRLHPPATASKHLPSSQPYIIPVPIMHLDGSTGTTSHDISGLDVLISHYLIHRNPAVWGPDARVFRPERWLDEKYMAQIRTGSWRPFEHGPRNCIGQELVMMETKIFLVGIARGFEYEKIGYAGAEALDGWGTTVTTAKGSLANGMPEVAGLPAKRDTPGKVSQEDRIGLDLKRTDLEVWNAFSFATVPVDGMKMRVRRIKSQEHLKG